MLNPEAFEKFCYWIMERETIRKLKESGVSTPWTKDPILQRHHFCNVRREDDRGTKERRSVVRRTEMLLGELPWVYTASNLFNRAATLQVYLEEGVAGVKAMQGKIFRTAYVVSTCGETISKIDYVDRLVQEVSRIRVPSTSCRAAYGALMEIRGLGSFLAGQIVADLKNDRYLVGMPDWHTFSVMGPGSKKGLEALFGPPVSHNTYDRLMAELERALPAEIRNFHLHRQDLQNCLCEFSKYWTYTTGSKGRRRYYP